MTDSQLQPSIVDRLRAGASDLCCPECCYANTMTEAADEIEALAGRLVKATGLINDGSDTLVKLINAETEIASLRSQVSELRAALGGLTNFAAGLSFAERDVKLAIGNTNWSVLLHWIAEGRAALAVKLSRGQEPWIKRCNGHSCWTLKS